MKSRTQIVLTLLAIVAVSALAGAFAGAKWMRSVHEKRRDPEAWNVAAMRTLERELQLSAEQTRRVQVVMDASVVELKTIRLETIAKSETVLEQMIAGIQQDLTPEQRQKFDALKAKRDRATLDILKVEPRKK